MDDTTQTTAASGATSDDDIKALQELRQSLVDEQTEIDAVYKKADEDIEAATADDMKTVNEGVEQLDQLEQQADAEEQQGQVGQARDQVQSS